MASSEAMTSSTHSFAYLYRCFQKCFVRICETSKCHNFLNFQPTSIQSSLFCSKLFTLSCEIKLNLFRISPLRYILKLSVVNSITYFLIIFFILFIFQQLQSLISQIDKNDDNSFWDETCHSLKKKNHFVPMCLHWKQFACFVIILWTFHFVIMCLCLTQVFV